MRQVFFFFLMHKLKTSYQIILIWVLPALLLLGTWGSFGCYFESNDDVAISQVLRGETALTPTTNLHLYFHGLAYLLATLYQLAPTFPWYGLLLYLLLYGSLVLAYQLLVDLLAPKLALRYLVGCLLLVYGFGWLETAVLMNFTRLPILLVGTGVLYGTNQRAHWLPLLIGGTFVTLGWSIRPSAAALGWAVALPGCWWLARWRAVIPVVSAGLLLAVLTAIVLATYSPVELAYRRMDVLLANYLDYELYSPHPQTPQDSLGLLAIQNRAFADSTVLTERLFTHSIAFDWAPFLHQTLRHKVYSSYSMFRVNYLWLILFLFVIGVGALIGSRGRQRGEFLAAHMAFAILLLCLTVGLKLPTRLASPLLSIWILCTLLYVSSYCSHMLRPTALGWVLLGGILIGHSRKLWIPSKLFRHHQAENEEYMRQVYSVARNRTLVVGGVEWAYQYLSPFKTYELSDSPALTLMGWLALEPSVGDLRQQMSGTRDFEQSLITLAADPKTLWLLQPYYVSYLNHYAQHHRRQSVRVLSLKYEKSLHPNAEFAQMYRALVVTRQ